LSRINSELEYPCLNYMPVCARTGWCSTSWR